MTWGLLSLLSLCLEQQLLAFRQLSVESERSSERSSSGSSLPWASTCPFLSWLAWSSPEGCPSFSYRGRVDYRHCWRLWGSVVENYGGAFRWCYYCIFQNTIDFLWGTNVHSKFVLYVDTFNYSTPIFVWCPQWDEYFRNFVSVGFWFDIVYYYFLMVWCCDVAYWFYFCCLRVPLFVLVMLILHKNAAKIFVFVRCANDANVRIERRWTSEIYSSRTSLALMFYA